MLAAMGKTLMPKFSMVVYRWMDGWRPSKMAPSTFLHQKALAKPKKSSLKSYSITYLLMMHSH
jgi:hypothetical protein